MAFTSDMSGGYPAESDIDSLLSSLGIELITDNNPNFIPEFKQYVWGIVNSVNWAMSLGVYCPSPTTFNVRGGEYRFSETVKTYTPGSAVDPTDNDTTYIWMKPDNTIGSDIDGNGWPATEHIKLAEIDVDASGNITDVRDKRGQVFFSYMQNFLYSTETGTSVEMLANHWDKATPANNDEVRIPIYGENDNDEKIEYGRIVIKLTDVADGSEDAEISLMRMIAGVLTSMGDIVCSSSVQTLTNKTIDGDDNTVQDLALSSLKTDAPNADKFLQRNGSGVVVDGPAVPVGAVVGISDTQALTNKTIDGDGNTISNVAGSELKNYSSEGGVLFCFTATLVAGNTVQIHNADSPFKFEIIDAWAINKSADGGTWKLTDGTNDITDAVACGGTDKSLTWAGTVDDAYNTISASGSLSVVGDGSLADCKVFVRCIRVA